MAFTWVRPADPTVLAGRPLLDLGTGDGQTLAALATGPGLAVGVDRSIGLLRPGGVNAEAEALPFRGESIATVLAADVFHHLDDAQLRAVLGEIARILRPNGRLVAWWYERTSDSSPDAPRYPRPAEKVRLLAEAVGLRVAELELVTTVESSPTAGIVATP